MNRIKGHLLYAVMLLCTFGLSAQTPVWQFTVGVGGTNSDAGYDIAVDSTGNQYITGYFSETAVFGSFTLTSNGYDDIFVAKLDPTGNFLWVVSAGGTNSDYGQSIAVDNAGHIYLTGYFHSSTAFFGPYTINSNGGYDIFAAKLDPTGNFLWAVSAGGYGYNDYSYSIAIDSMGNSYLNGYFENTAIFGQYSLTSSGETDIFASKLDPAGNWLWAVRAGGSVNDKGYGIAVDSVGNAYLTGFFHETATFGNYELTANGESDIFVCKLDPAGNYLWAVSAGGAYFESGYDITMDNIGNIYLNGWFERTATFGQITLTSSYDSNIFTTKMDPAGNFLWAVSADCTSTEICYSIAVDSTGNTYLTGFFYGTAIFNTYSLNSSGEYDIFAAKLDPAGNFLWAVNAGGSSIDVGEGIAVDSIGNLYLTGYFYGNSTFGPYTLTSVGESDIFIAKLSSGVPVNDDLAPELSSLSVLSDAYPNPLRKGESATIKTNIADRKSGTLSIFDLRGRCIACYQIPSGEQQITLDSRDLPSGIYFYQLKTQSAKITKKLVLLK